MAATQPAFKDVHKVAKKVNHEQHSNDNRRNGVYAVMILLGLFCMGATNHSTTTLGFSVFFIGLALFAVGVKGVLLPNGVHY